MTPDSVSHVLTLPNTSPPVELRIHAEHPDAIPVYASLGAAGADLKACIEAPITLQPGDIALISTGLKMEIPIGFEVQLRPRSGLALKHGLTLPNSPATIDSDYRGDVKVILMNLGKEPFTVTRWMRIAQMVVARVETAKFIVCEAPLSSTDRGAGGFGHTGTH